MMHTNVYETPKPTNSSSSTTGLLSLRQLQINIILNMLNYNETVQKKLNSKGKSSQPIKDKPIWKVLLFDRFSQQLVGSILKVNDLRDSGVTLHLPIEAKRMAIGDVPAIYLLRPSLENINLVVQDLRSNLYDSTYLNFTSTLPRPLLEELASRSVADNSFAKISQVYDQYLNYQCLDSNLFSLEVPDCFSIFHSKVSSEELIERAVEEIVLGLVSVLVSLDEVPTIKAVKGNAAEMVAKRLEAKLREFSRATVNSLPTKDSVFSLNRGTHLKGRPVLILVDRNFDLIPMVQHAWDYQPLTHDLLDLDHNRCTLPPNPPTTLQPHRVDIDLEDRFWDLNKSLPFPQVAEAIDSALNQYKLDAERLTKSEGASDLLTKGALDLKLAVDALPELTQRKLYLDLHMNLATALLGQIQARHLDRFVELEASILRQPRSTILDLLHDPECANQDKLRLVLVYYLSHPNLSPTYLNPLVEVLNQNGIDTKPIDAVTKLLSISRMSTLSAGNQSTSNLANTSPNSGNSDLLERFASIGSQLRDNAYGKLLTKVKDFLPIPTDLALTKLVANSLESQTATASAYGINPLSLGDELLHLDPRSSSPMARSTPPLVSTAGTGGKPSTVVVFVIGGGNYLEFQNLEGLTKKFPHLKRIVYGSTQLLNPQQFLNQLETIL